MNDHKLPSSLTPAHIFWYADIATENGTFNLPNLKMVILQLAICNQLLQDIMILHIFTW